MSNQISLKKSSVADKVPLPGDLQFGELALNYTDGNLFYKNSSNTVTTIASNKFTSVTGNVIGGNITTTGLISATGNVTAGNVTYTNVDGTSGQYLTTHGNGATYWSSSTSTGQLSVYLRGGSNIQVQILNGFLNIVGRNGNIAIPIA